MISFGQEMPFLKVCAQISLQFLPIVRTIPEIESVWLRSFFIAVIGVVKSDNLQYAGSLGLWAKRLIDQASDIPSIIFFHNFLKTLGTQNSLFLFL